MATRVAGSGAPEQRSELVALPTRYQARLVAFPNAWARASAVRLTWTIEIEQREAVAGALVAYMIPLQRSSFGGEWPHAGESIVWRKANRMRY